MNFFIPTEVFLLIKRLSKFFATAFYVGLIPIAPGTMASLEALVWIYLFFPKGTVVQIILCVLSFALGVFTARVMTQETGHPDPPQVVIDEVCGMFITFFMIPISAKSLVLGFILFRVFDIFKLPWIRRMETIPHGYGVMADDVAAGLLSHIALRLILSI